MKAQRTVKVKLPLTPEQILILLATMEEANKVFALAVSLCLQYRTTNYFALYKRYYQKAKELCPNLPVAYIQGITKQACAAVKSFNSRNPKKKWEYKGRRSAFSLPLDKNLITRRGDLITISSIAKRIRFFSAIPQWFLDKYKVDSDKIQSGHILYRKGSFYLCAAYNIDLPPLRTQGKTVGVDRGLYNLVATSDGMILPSSHLARKRRFQHLRRTLQQQGTRSAKRKLKILSGREKRFMRDVNHIVSKMLASDPDVKIYVLEKLTNIRKRRKGKKLNRWLGNWSFHQLQSFLAYKCAEKGISLTFVSPKYTSQICNKCGKVDKNSRQKGRFVCSCGHKDHADINAAKNIRDKHASTRIEDRAPFNRPNASVKSDGCNASVRTDSSVLVG